MDRLVNVFWLINYKNYATTRCKLLDCFGMFGAMNLEAMHETNKTSDLKYASNTRNLLDALNSLGILGSFFETCCYLWCEIKFANIDCKGILPIFKN